MNVMTQIAEARAQALTLQTSARACSGEQGALKFRLQSAANSLNSMVLIAVRAIDCIEQLTSVESTVEQYLIQAQLLLEDARVAAQGGHPVTHDLQRQARELIGAALDRCAPVSP